jgi:hypothetical protein
MIARTAASQLQINAEFVMEVSGQFVQSLVTDGISSCDVTEPGSEVGHAGSIEKRKS